ncbi:excisionase family DNA binding protein [Lentzea atacamensis]|uniref:Excisionase family DNA binding protein n=2 Tax=Lentzea TaxID=165301 RepID=A0ABX9DUW9_9PSEU|nr:helix-turn-helix domain-containing protein [Lentzea atacamensis]RAS57108.1 excisionase family DNA binding protein [Lentzea atacamensis]
MARHTTTHPGADQPRTLLSVEEAARRLSVGRTTMFNLIKSGQVASVQIGRLRRISTAALADYATRLAAGPEAA